MKITIVTATYNRTKEIENLYNSIKKQTHKNWEWIIVDDYSDIKNYHFVKSITLRDPRVKLLRNFNNRKQEYSRNKAIKLATGDIITNIDSDDDIPINRLEIINDAFTREKECDVLYGGWTLVRGDKQTYFSPNPYNPEDFFMANRINNNAAAWKRSCNLFYDEDYPYGCGDYSLWMCAIARGLRFMTADINLVFWKNNPGCHSIDKHTEMEHEAIEVRKFWSKPKISIIMPTYNRTTYLKDAIKSVTRQTFENWELLVVDDGSKLSRKAEYPKDYDPVIDEPPRLVKEYNEVKEIVDEFKDARIKYFRKENGGLSSALNFGLDRCNGDYIALLDDDDLWMCYHLEMLYKTIIGSNKKLDPGDKPIGVIYGQTSVGKIRADGNTIEVHRDCLCKPFKKRQDLLWMNHLTTCSVLFDKKIVYQKGLYFDESLDTHMDWDFWIRLSKDVEFLFLGIKSSIYRMHDNNMLAHSDNQVVGVTKVSSWEDMGKVQMKHIKF